ncbi:MAG: response regulator [bacterium]
MNDLSEGKTPQAFGEEVPPEKITRVFEHVLSGTTDIVLFDGNRDFDSRVLSHLHGKVNKHVLIIDDTTPPLPKSLLEKKITLLGRVQYFQAGLHHRISFQTNVLKRAIYVGHQALWMDVLLPVRLVSNLYVSMPSENHPVLLEIPVAGAPPQVRVIELSTSKLKVYAPEAKKLFPEAINVEGLKLQLIDIGRAQLSGIMRAVSQEHAELDITEVQGDSKGLLDEYLNHDFLRTQKRSISASPSSFSMPEEPSPVPVQANTLSKTALVLVEQSSVRERYVRVLQDLGYQVEKDSRFELATPDMVRGRSLLVMDAVQAPTHAESWIETWIQDGLIQPCRFILIGDDVDPDHRRKWTGLGEGLCLRPSYPADWISNRLMNWIAESSSVSQESQREEKEKSPGTIDSNVRILCVDDELDMQEVIKDVLNREGFQVVTASNGQEAVRLARHSHFDLILLDLLMPQYNGISTLETIRQFSKTKDIPVIIVSGNYPDASVHKITDLGISGFIAKPFRPEELLDKIKRVLARRVTDT